MVETVLSLEGNCKSISEEVGAPRQVAPLLLALHGALVPSLVGATGSICIRWAFWPAVVCLKCRRSTLLAKGGDGAGVVLAQESVELLSSAGMWPGAGRRWGRSRQSLEKPFYSCFDLSSVQVIRIRA